MPYELTGSGVVVCRSSTTLSFFYPLMGWIPAADLYYVLGYLKQDADTGYAAIKAAVQWVNDIDSPESAIELGGCDWVSGDGENTPTAAWSASSYLEDYQYARFGVLARHTTSQQPQQCCHAHLRIQIIDRPIERTSYYGVVLAGSENEHWWPLSPWFDAAKFREARAQTYLEASTGQIQVATGYQTCIDQDNPDSCSALVDGTGWNNTDHGFANPSDWDDIRSDLLGKQYVRFGVRAKLNSQQSGLHCARVRLTVDSRFNVE